MELNQQGQLAVKAVSIFPEQRSKTVFTIQEKQPVFRIPGGALE